MVLVWSACGGGKRDAPRSGWRFAGLPRTKPDRGHGCVGRRVDHEGADREVTAEVPPDLLLDQVGRLGTQHRPRPALMRIQLIEGGLDLPPLGGDGGEVPGTGLGGIQGRRE